jgi:hypothetical protein
LIVSTLSEKLALTACRYVLKNDFCKRIAKKF